MDKDTIKKNAQQLESREDLRKLLNRIKRDELAELGITDRFYPITDKHLNYYCNPKHSFHRYKEFKIKKKTGGYRQITAPRNQSFMLILQSLNSLLKSIYTPSEYAMGFTEGRSVVTNAEQHRGMNYVLNLDLKDFFPSIDQARVWKRLQLPPFNFPVPIASAIAGLCCMRTMVEDESGNKVERFVLPQGAPTSPIITNMICDRLDHRLAGLARRFGVRYTRYADDITFSSMHHIYQANGEFFKELYRIIGGQGFTVNEKKTRLQKKGSRQEVTGIIVSDKLNVTQKYVRDVRNVLYIWDRYGYNVAYGKFLPKYKQDKGHVKKGTPNLINVIDGKLMYLKMVKGEEDSVYLKLYAKFRKLANAAQDNKKKNSRNTTYVETISVEEFEKKNSTTISIEYSEEKVKIESRDGSCMEMTKSKCEEVKNSLQNEIIKEISKIPAHRFATFELGGRKIYASVNKSLTKEEEQDKAQLAISSCLDFEGKPFWLIHKADKVVVSPAKRVNIDELNKELDSLLNM